jgi:hypothetical protein
VDQRTAITGTLVDGHSQPSDLHLYALELAATIVAVDALVDAHEHGRPLDPDTIRVENFDSAATDMWLSCVGDGCVAAITGTDTWDLATSFAAVDAAHGSPDDLPHWRPELRAALDDGAPIAPDVLADGTNSGLYDLLAVTSHITTGNLDEFSAAVRSDRVAAHASTYAAPAAVAYLADLLTHLDSTTTPIPTALDTAYEIIDRHR